MADGLGIVRKTTPQQDTKVVRFSHGINQDLASSHAVPDHILCRMSKPTPAELTSGDEYRIMIHIMKWWSSLERGWKAVILSLFFVLIVKILF